MDVEGIGWELLAERIRGARIQRGGEDGSGVYATTGKGFFFFSKGTLGGRGSAALRRERGRRIRWLVVR